MPFVVLLPLHRRPRRSIRDLLPLRRGSGSLGDDHQLAELTCGALPTVGHSASTVGNRATLPVTALIETSRLEAFHVQLPRALNTAVPWTRVTRRPPKPLPHVVAGSLRHLNVPLPPTVPVSLTSSEAVPPVLTGETNGRDLRGEGCQLSRRRKDPPTAATRRHADDE